MSPYQTKSACNFSAPEPTGLLGPRKQKIKNICIVTPERYNQNIMKRVMLISAGFLLVMVGLVSADSEGTVQTIAFWLLPLR